MSSLYPEMRFSWEIKSVDALFCNGLARVGDLSKEAILQAIKDGDLRFLQVSQSASVSRLLLVTLSDECKLYIALIQIILLTSFLKRIHQKKYKSNEASNFFKYMIYVFSNILHLK